MTVETAGIFDSYVLLVHQLFVFVFFKLLLLVMAGLTTCLINIARIQHQGRFEFAVFKKGLVRCSPRALDDVQMAAGTGYLGFFKHLMGDGFFARGLDRLLGQFVAQFASPPAFVELGIFEMTQVAGGFAGGRRRS